MKQINSEKNKHQKEKVKDQNATKLSIGILGKNKVFLFKLGIVMICAAIVAMIIAIAKNQEIFQELLRIL